MTLALFSAISATRSPARLDTLSQAIAAEWGSGRLSDENHNAIASAIAARRRELFPKVAGLAELPLRRRPKPRSFDRVASIARRRRLAASGPMPPALAANFTTGELAALRIVGDAVKASGRCAMTIGEIAARAGVGESTARNALRTAARLGLLTIEERRRPGMKNLPNIVRIVSKEWLAWIGFKKPKSTDNQESNRQSASISMARPIRLGGKMKRRWQSI